jgi:hypothetical protein
MAVLVACCRVRSLYSLQTNYQTFRKVSSLDFVRTGDYDESSGQIFGAAAWSFSGDGRGARRGKEERELKRGDAALLAGRREDRGALSGAVLGDPRGS